MFQRTFASTAYVPAQQKVKTAFDTSETKSLLPFSFFMLGLALGPMISAPISERFGRRPVYHVGLLAFAIFTSGAGLSRSLPALITLRFFAGAFGGSVLVVGFGVLTDIWSPAQLPVALSVFNTIPFCGPAIGYVYF